MHAIEQAVRRTRAGGSTALYNAVYIALKELNKTTRNERIGQPLRRAIVVLSDGEDTSSLMGFDEVIDLAARSDIAIYAIGMMVPGLTETRGSQDAQFVLRRLAQQTGGRAFFPRDVAELASIYNEIKAELSSQYSLAYESSNTRRDGQFQADRHPTRSRQRRRPDQARLLRGDQVTRASRAEYDMADQGLTSAEAARRMAKVGPNDPVVVHHLSTVLQLLRLFLNPLVVILLVASTISALLGQTTDAAIIVTMVLLGVGINPNASKRATQS